MTHPHNKRPPKDLALQAEQIAALKARLGNVSRRQGPEPYVRTAEDHVANARLMLGLLTSF